MKGSFFMTFTIDRARKILGKSSNKYTDEDLASIINNLTGVAEIITSVVGSKTETMGIESLNKKGDHRND